MSLSVRKFIAVLLAVWLPLFSGVVLAASVSMQMPHGTCHEMMQNDHQHDQGHADQPSDHQDSSCDQCSICHLACSSYLGVQDIKNIEVIQMCASATPYLFSFHSITSAPLLPPPLA